MFWSRRSRCSRKPSFFRPALVDVLEPRRMLAGNVAVTVNPGGDILRIIGDNSANRIDISYNDGTGEIVVTPTDGTTTINGGAMFAQAFAMPPSIRMRLQDGSDSVTGTLRKSMPEPEDSRPIIDEGFFRLGRGIDTFDMQIDYDTLVTVIGDSGNDTITLEGFNLDTASTPATGPEIEQAALRVLGFDGDDVIDISGSEIAGSFFVDSGNDNDTISTSVVSRGQQRFDLGAGNDILSAGGLFAGERFVVKARTGNDAVKIDSSVISLASNDTQPIRVDLDSGDDSFLIDGSVISLNRPLTSNPNGSFTSGTIAVIAGTGDDRVYTYRSNILAGGFDVDLGPDDDAAGYFSSSTTLSGAPGMDGTPAFGGGRYSIRGRGGNDVVAFGDESGRDQSDVTTVGKVVIDTDAGDDTIVVHSTEVDVFDDLVIRTDFGIDRVAFSSSVIDLMSNDLDVLMGADDDHLLVCGSAEIIDANSLVIDGSSGNDRLAVEGTATLPPAPTILSVEDQAASVSTLSDEVAAVLDTLALELAGDERSNVFADIADELCS